MVDFHPLSQIFLLHLHTADASSTLRVTEVPASPQRLEAVFVAAAAAVPEAGAFTLIFVKEPHYGVVLAAAGDRAEETGVWMETGHRDEGVTRSTSLSSCFIGSFQPPMMHELLSPGRPP